MFEVIGDAPVPKDDDEPMAEDAGPMAHYAKTADTTTPQVHVVPITTTSSPPPVLEKKVCIIPFNFFQVEHTNL